MPLSIGRFPKSIKIRVTSIFQIRPFYFIHIWKTIRCCYCSPGAAMWNILLLNIVKSLLLIPYTHFPEVGLPTLHWAPPVLYLISIDLNFAPHSTCLILLFIFSSDEATNIELGHCETRHLAPPIRIPLKSLSYPVVFLSIPPIKLTESLNIILMSSRIRLFVLLSEHLSFSGIFKSY